SVATAPARKVGRFSAYLPLSREKGSTRREVAAMAIAKTDNVLQQVHRALVACSAEQLSDRELLRRFADGHDQDAFAAVVRRHGAMVLNVCRRALHNPHDAEDIFQATFLA